MSDQTQQKPWWKKNWIQNILWGLAFLAIFLILRPYMQGEVAEGAAPNIEAANLKGDAIALSDFKGQPVMVHFWATWCPICELEASNIESVAEDYAVINIATQSGSDLELIDYAKQNGLATQNIVNDMNGSLFQQYGAKAIPATFFIDESGQISTVEVGYTTTIGMVLRLWWLD